jgi:RimJ/RimL family protein N-acetyltransferase
MRPVEMRDAATVSDWYQQVEDVSIFDRQSPVPINSVEVSNIVESIITDQKKEKCAWYVVENEQGEMVAMSGLELISQLHGNAIIPVFVAAEWRRTGVGIRICGMMIDLGFRQLRLHRIGTLFRADNTATAILAERCGLKKEGVSREAWFSGGKYHDVVNVGILADEWESSRLELARSINPNVTLSLGPRPSRQWVWPPPEDQE